MIEVTTTVLASHPFVRGMRPDHVDTIGKAVTEVTFDPGQRIFQTGGHAGKFWLIQSGHVLLDLRMPDGDAMIVETAGIGDLLGWSWLFPPFSWTCGAVALRPVRALEFDAAAVRASCEADPALGAELTRRTAVVMARRLTAIRTRLLSVSACASRV